MKRYSTFLASFFLIIAFQSFVFATSYYSKTGQTSPNSTTSWSTTTNGTGPSPNNFTSGDVFIVQLGHSMTTTAPWTVSGTNAQIFINGGTLTLAHSTTTQQLTISSGDVTVNFSMVSTIILTVNNGNAAGEDLLVGSSGPANLYNSGRLLYGTGATGKVSNTGTYTHTATINNEPIPIFTWTTFSSCKITGITTTLPTGFGQSFGNLIYDCPSQTVNDTLKTAPTTISNFTINSTGTKSLVLGTNISPSTSLTINGGIFDLSSYTANGLVLASSINIGASATMRIGGSNSFPLNYSTHNLNSSSTVEYYGSAAQTIAPEKYGNLSISGTRNGNISLSITDTISIGGILNLGVTFTTGNFVTTGSTIEFRGNISQIIQPLPGAIPYHSIVVNKNIGGVDAGGSLTLTGDLALVQGYFSDYGFAIMVKGNILGSNGNHFSVGSGKIVLTNGSSQHQISDVDFGTLEINDALGAATIGSPIIKDLKLTNGIFTLNHILSITGGGKISATTGNLSSTNHVIFNGNGVVTGTVSFDTVQIYGAVDFGTGSTINGILSINPGGMVIAAPPLYLNVPTYGIGSTLLYASGGIFNRGWEWSSTSGAGYPHHVIITNNTSLNLSGIGGSAIARQISGNLTIDPASELTMNQDGSEMTAPLTVLGNLVNNGTLSLSSIQGGNLILNGNFDYNGTLNSYNRSVVFSGGANQLITRNAAGTIYFDSLVIDKTSNFVEIPDTWPVTLSISKNLTLQNGLLRLNGTVTDIAAYASVTAASGNLDTLPNVFNLYNASAITGTINLWDVNIFGTVSFGIGSNLYGMMYIMGGSSVMGNAPTYKPGSTLVYNSGGTFNRGLEWSSTNGPGYPFHVQVSNTTLLNIGDYFGLSIPLQTGGNITIDAASEISMNVYGQEMLWPLTVNGNLINNGMVTLAGIYNGSLNLKGNFINNGSLISNTRPVIFSGNSDQLITRSTAGTVYFDSLVINNPSNVVEVANTPFVALWINKNLTLQNGLLRLNGTVTDIGANATITSVTGNFDTLSNDINFNGFNSFSGTVDLQNIKLFGSVDFGTDSKLHKMMYLMSGGSVSTNPPLYLPGSTLSYHSGGTFYRGLEWSALSGPGYPYNVEINNNTLLNFGGLDQTLPTAIEGNLVVMRGSTFSMSEDGWEMSAPLTVNGSVQNYGNIVLSYLSGNDLNIQRDLFQSDGVLTTNNSIMSFFGTGNSTIDGIGTVDKVQMNKSIGTLTLGNDLVINDTLFLTGGNINTGSFAVEMSNGSTVARTAGHVNGNLRKYIPTSASILENFEIGDSIVYSPVSVAFSNISANDFLTASTSLSGPSLTGTNINESKNVNRFWTLSAGAVTFDSFNATFTFEPTDIDSGANTNDFTLWRHNGSSWIDVVEGTRTATSTQGIGIDGFQTFAVGQLNPFTITPTASAGGNISPNIVTEVPGGGNLNVTITPDAGFHIDSVLVDGVSIGVVQSYDFNNVVAAHTIDAFFSINTYTLTTNATNGTITKTPDQSLYDHGTVVDLQAIPNYGYDFTGWSGDTTGMANPLSLTMDMSKTIDANFVYSAPAAPQNLTASAGDGMVSLHWNPNFEGDIVKYYLYAGTSLYPTVIVDSTIGGLNDTLKIVGGLTNYQQYYFRVTAADTNGYIGTYSDQVGAIPTDTTKPEPPQNLVAVAGDGEATIQWDGNGESDFGKYYIYSGLSPNPTTITDSTISIIDTIRTYTGLTNYQQYYFRIAAMDTSGNLSSYSNEIMVMPYDQTGLPVPASVQIIDSLQSSFTIQWGKTTGSDFRAYLIYGGTTPSPEFLVDSTTNINDTSKVISGLTAGTPYYFFVTAIDTNGNESGASNHVSATPYVNIKIIAKKFGSGIISPIDTTFVTPGNSLLYSYFPGNNYHFDSVLVDGIRNVDSLISYTFSSVVSDHTIDVYFSIDTYNLNVISAQGIVNKIPDSLQYSHGMEVQLTAVPNPGYSFSIWGGDTSTANNPFIITVDTIKNITAFYTLNTYSLTTNAVNGTVLKTPDSSMYSYGMPVVLIAIPDSGYSFIGWSGDTVELNNPITVSMYNEKNITANFSLNVYQVTSSVFGDGTIVPPGITNVNFGDTVHYSFSPNTGSHFDSLVVNDAKIDSVNSFTFFNITTAHSITAYFSPNVFHHFIIEAGSGGAINPQTAGQTFSIRTTAVDSLDNIVTSFTGNVWFSSTDTLMGVLGGNYSIPFIAGQHGPQILALYRAGNNTISVIDSLSGKKGTSTPFVVNPSGLSHFVVKDTFGLDILQQVQAFPFLIKIIASDTYGNVQSDFVGSVDVSVSGGAIVTQGSGATPNFSSGILDSHILKINSSGFYTINVFNNLTGKSGASNYFTVVPNTYSINSSAVNGTISPMGSTIANYGDTVTFAFTPKVRHHFDSLYVDGIKVNDSTTQYTFTNVISAHAIDAYFSANPNIPPLFTSVLSDTAIARFDTLHFQYKAVDPDSGAITFSLLNPPSGASIDSTGLLRFIPAANANGINFVVVQVKDDSLTFVNDTVKIRVNIYGDVSGNGGITAYDAALVLQNVVDTTMFTSLQKRIGDVSGNGEISALDASYLLQYSVGLISSFPGGLGKQQQDQAILSAFSFRIEKSKEPNQYDLYISVNKPSQVFGLSMDLGYDSSIVIPNSFYKTALTDSMVMASKFFSDQVKIAMAGINPMNNAGDIIKFSFLLKDPNYPKNALLFTMKKFILNETDHTNEIGGITLNVRDLAQLPTVYKLEQNFPNPFNPTTTISYQLPDASSVKIVVYNMLGQEVKTLINEHQLTGYYSMLWNGMDNSNRKVSSGVYIYRIEAVGLQNKRFIDVKKMMLIK